MPSWNRTLSASSEHKAADDMNAEFLSKIVRTSTYKLKEGTKASFYFQSGNKLLPNRLSIIVGIDCTPISRSGRGTLPKAGQMKGNFTAAEESPYKQYKPYAVNTSLWPVEGLQRYFYGTLGITGSAGSIDSDCGDLVLLFTSDWQEVRLSVFRGLAQPARLPEYLQQAVSFLQSQQTLRR